MLYNYIMLKLQETVTLASFIPDTYTNKFILTKTRLKCLKKNLNNRRHHGKEAGKIFLISYVRVTDIQFNT